MTMTATREIAKSAQLSALVIGSDQTLSLDDEVFHKPADMEGARGHLLTLSGKTHQLNSAAVLVPLRPGVPSTASCPTSRSGARETPNGSRGCRPPTWRC